MNPGRGWAPALVASWQRPQPDALARVLQPLSWLYRALAAGQRALFASGLRSSQRAPRPLIVVGNLLVGGAGKTPTVIALVELLRQLGYTPGVVSRGYGRADRTTRIVDAASSADAGGRRAAADPPAHARAGGSGRATHRRGALLCRAHPELDVLVADDGLQHLALARDAQLIVFDERGVGNGLLLPAGPLREPLPRALPERTLVIYNAPQPSTALPGFVVRRSLAGVVELAGWWQGQRADPQGWQALARSSRRGLRGHRGAATILLHAAGARPGLRAAGVARPRRLQPLAVARRHARRRGDRERRRQDPPRARGPHAGVGGAARLRFRRRGRPGPEALAAASDMTLDHRLIDLLVCPLCKGPLRAEHPPGEPLRELVCPVDRLAFPVRDGIAVMLESEARALDAPSAPSPLE